MWLLVVCNCRMLQLSSETTLSLQELLLSALPLQHDVDDRNVAACILACLAQLQDASASKLHSGVELLKQLLPQLSASDIPDQASQNSA